MLACIVLNPTVTWRPTRPEWGGSGRGYPNSARPDLQYRAMANLTAALRHLERERNHLSKQLAQVNDALSALDAKKVRPKRRMSAAAIARIRAAQLKRWAKWRKSRRAA